MRTLLICWLSWWEKMARVMPWLTAVVASMVVVRVAGALAGKDKGAEMVAVMLLILEWRWGNDEGGGVWRGGGEWRRV
ncbi:hypothetical protein Tco_0075391, partial [Tanacetum coccineum]